MQNFIQRFGSRILGILSGFDRLRFRGSFRLLSGVSGMAHFLSLVKVKINDFGRYAEETTDTIRSGVENAVKKGGLKVEYIQSSAVSKEKTARRILEERKISSGLICVLSCKEPCRSYDVFRNRYGKGCPDLVSRQRQCLHYYHYYLDPMFGLLHVRTQTWFPFSVHIWVNGREWLAQQLDAAQIGYLRHDNCFPQIDNITRAQRLMDRQWHLHWSKHLKRLACCSNPSMKRLFPQLEIPLEYYWTLEESEWATDVMFTSPQELEQLYPRLILHGMQTFGSRDVMRFLGRKTPVTQGKYGKFAGEVISDVRKRAEGVCIRHRINRNSLKMYDKGGSVLRIETTINEPRDMKVFRHKEGDLQGPRKWRPMRKGIADIRRRVEVSQAANERYLNSLAEVDCKIPLGQMLGKLSQPTEWNGRRVRGLNPFEKDDQQLLEAISRGELLLNGFRNRDIRLLLFGSENVDQAVRRRQSSAVSRKLRLLRAHHLIKKVPTTHRYQLTEFGRAVVTALTAAKNADTAKLAAVA